MTGPLAGISVVELPAIGPAPFGAMVLAGLGADVVRIERPGAQPLFGGGPAAALLQRGRRSVALDLKEPLAVEAVLRLVDRSDALIEGWRPGVAERLGLGPEVCLARNSRLVYGRMTGWGQEGPLARAAGHDINYIALSGVLHAIGTAGGPPVVPLNLVGDFGGGGLVLALGLLAAIVEARRSGKGQVVDAAMVDGAALLATAYFGYLPSGAWRLERGTNLLDGGAPFYGVYETADGRHVAVGAIEPQFFAALLDGLDLDAESLPGQADIEGWPRLRDALAAAFRGRTRDEWAEHFANTDACVSPVLDFSEAPRHAHNEARRTFVEAAGVIQPAPAPRFERTPASLDRPPVQPGADTAAVLAELGFDDDDVARLGKPR